MTSRFSIGMKGGDGFLLIPLTVGVEASFLGLLVRIIMTHSLLIILVLTMGSRFPRLGGTIVCFLF